MEYIDVDARYSAWLSDPTDNTMNSLLASMRQQAYFQARHAGTEAGEIADYVCSLLLGKLNAVNPSNYRALSAHVAAVTTTARLKRAIELPYDARDEDDSDPGPYTFTLTAKQLAHRLLPASFPEAQHDNE